MARPADLRMLTSCLWTPVSVKRAIPSSDRARSIRSSLVSQRTGEISLTRLQVSLSSRPVRKQLSRSLKRRRSILQDFPTSSQSLRNRLDLLRSSLRLPRNSFACVKDLRPSTLTCSLLRTSLKSSSSKRLRRTTK